MDVLDLYCRVINKNSDSKGQTAERHYVDGLSQETQNDERSKNGKRDGKTDDQRTAPTSQEQQNHEPGQEGGNSRFPHNPAHRCTNEKGLIEEGRDSKSGRKGCLHRR